jgi:hypothetical protein
MSIIEKAQTFDHSKIFNYFKKDIKTKYGVEDDTLTSLLQREAIRFLIMCVIYPEKNFNMHNKLVDEYWHTFMLFSSEYFSFCETLGSPYIHHAPNIEDIDTKGTDNVKDQSFSEFEELYKKTFNEDLPEVWKQDSKVWCKKIWCKKL